MKDHRLSLLGLVIAFWGLALAGYQPSHAPAVLAALKAPALHSHSKVAPKSSKKAKALVGLAVTQLFKDYSAGRAKDVCGDLTANARKALGGASVCASSVQYARTIRPISKVKISAIVLRRARASASVTGYLTGNHKHRLTVTFKWEGGRYRFDHSVATLIALFR